MKMKLGVLGFLAFFALLQIGAADVQCIDEDGQPVDWYVLYKLPVIKDSKDVLIRRGLAYLYLTPNTLKKGWTLSSLSINDTRSMPARTIAPLYDGKVDEKLYILYNDEPPMVRAGSTFGHTKGTVIAQDGGGLWLVHSVPKFPLEPINPLTNKPNAYQYPLTGTRYGQSFLCMSLPASQLNVLGNQLMFNKPKVFKFGAPEVLTKLYSNLTEAGRSKYIRQPPWYQKALLKTYKGMKFTSYAKTGSFGKELYVSWIAPDIQSNLQVETWANGRGEIPSDCKAAFQVMDVEDVSIRLNSTPAFQFKNTNDHSKWAISDEKHNVVCIGDINRMEAQLKRGGGTVCFQSPAVWKLYANSIQGVQPCPKT